MPESVVVPEFEVKLVLPAMPVTVPPVDVTAPVSAPFFKMPPASDKTLMVCAKPPRSSVPPLLIPVALAALNALAAPASNVPPLIAVAPV